MDSIISRDERCIQLSELWRESLIIDSTFLIDNVERGKLNEALIRFCLQENDETKVIEIKNNGEFEVTFNMKQKEINDQEIEKEDYKNESIQLEGFIDSNTLLLKQRRD